MPLTRRQLLPFSAGALLVAGACPSRAETAAPGFRRGAGLHNVMNWGLLREDDRTRYVQRPFDTPRNAMPEALLREFAGAGFDFVRLSLDVGPFIQLQGADRLALERQLIDHVERLHGYGLDVLVDCHPVEQVPLYSPPPILDDLEGPLFGEYTALIGRLATALAQVRSGRVALELMNEPTMKDASHRTQVMVWGAAQLALHDAARRAAPNLPLLLTGADFGGISGLNDLDPSPFAASNVLYSFHYYMPLSFTHQGVDFGSPNAPVSPYVSDLPYPYDAVPASEVVEAMEKRIADAPLDGQAKAAAKADAMRILDGFLDEAWNRDRIARDFETVASWADRNGIDRHRIVMGEFGVTRRSPQLTGAAEAFRRNWMGDVSALARSAGFGWSAWDLNSFQMGINRADDPDRLDLDLVSRLAMAG